MAGEEVPLRLSKRKSQVIEDPQQLDEQQKTLLGHVGSAVHALGSALSLPSRVVHGGINYATGGEGGFGNLNPIDATGGIEGSRHLIRAGILPENDPTKWEIHDVTRGLADVAMDPTTWVTPMGLTAKGVQASKVGGLGKGVAKQLVRGERALLSVRAPFQGVVGHVGTGRAIVDNAQKFAKISRLDKAARAISSSAVGRGAGNAVRLWRGLMNAAYEGTTHLGLHHLMPDRFDQLGRANRKVDETVVRIGRDIADMPNYNPSGWTNVEAASTRLKMTPSQMIQSALEGVTPKAALPAELHGHFDELKDMFDKAIPAERLLGTGWNGPLRDSAISGYGPRYKSESIGEMMGGGSRARAMLRKEILKGFYGGTHAEHGVNSVLQWTANQARNLRAANPTWTDKQIASAIMPDFVRQYGAGTRAIPGSAPGAWIDPTYVTKGGKTVDRYEKLVKYAVKNDHLADRPLFGNDPLADIRQSLQGSYTRRVNAKTAAKAFADNIGKVTDGVTFRDAAIGLKYRPEQMANQVASLMGAPLPNNITNPAAYKTALSNLYKMKLDPELVKQMKFAVPRTKKSAAVETAANWWQQGMNMFKAGVLAFPSSRVRDLVSGHIQNILHGWGLPGSGSYTDSARLMAGETVKRDYSHVRDVIEWFKKNPNRNIKNKADQTEALRQLVAVHLPREHGFLADFGKGSTGAQLEHVLRNVPGQTKRSVKQQFITGPLSALNPRNWGRRASKWSLPDEANPLAIRGFGGRTETAFAPVKASEQFSEASDILNRNAGFLHQLHAGTVADVAGPRVGAAQVNYDPRTYSDVEKGIKRNIAPFYSFTSRMVPHTAGQLLDMGSPTSQLMKAQTRAYGGNPAVPDYVLDSSGVPLGQGPDGGLQYLTGLGLMHEPAAKMLGQVASGDVRGLGLNALSNLNPFMGRPLEQLTGKSFWRDGEPIENLESNSGRLLANIGELTGLRPKGDHAFLPPVSFPGQQTADFVSSLTPAERLLSTARQLTDVRRGLGGLVMRGETEPTLAGAAEVAKGLAPAVSGLRLTDVSPQKQIFTLRKRAEKLAKEHGAKERLDVYFNKDELERLKEIDPVLAEKQIALQHMVNRLKAKKKKDDKKKA